MRQIYYVWAFLPLGFFILASLFRLREGTRPSTFFYGPRSSEVYFRYHSRPIQRLGFVFLFVWLVSVILVELDLSDGIGAWVLEFCPPELRETLLPAAVLLPTFAGMILFRLIGWRQADHEALSGGAQIVQTIFVGVFSLIIVAGEPRSPDDSCPWCSELAARWKARLPKGATETLARTLGNVGSNATKQLGLDQRGEEVLRLPPPVTGTPAPSGDPIIEELLKQPADTTEPYRYMDTMRARLAEARFAAEKRGSLDVWLSVTAQSRRVLLSRVLDAFQTHVRENPRNLGNFPEISEWVAQGSWLPEEAFLSWLQRSVGAHDLVLGSDTIVGNILLDEIYFTWSEKHTTL